MKIHDININFDFTMDTPNYWHNFWAQDDLLGCAGNDPDSYSKTLQVYHKLLWSKELPNGQEMNLEIGKGRNYLQWKNFCFGSDSIIASFRYKRYRNMIENVSKLLPNYQYYMEDYLHKSYTIGGEIIFPKKPGGINQSRGCNIYIKDRWDLTLECIRLYYLNQRSPLYEVLLSEKEFFNLFIDFRGYIDFFFLQDCVSPDYKSIIFWGGDKTFSKNPLPKTPQEYLTWISKELEFVSKRNTRIQSYINGLKTNF